MSISTSPLFSEIGTMWANYFAPLISLLLPMAIAVVAVSSVVALVGAIATKNRFAVMLLFVSPYAWLGAVCGTIAGASNEAVIGALLTGMLTIVAALMSYIFSKEALAEWRVFVPFAIVLLCLGALVGLSMGRAYKAQWDEFDRDQAKWDADNIGIYIPMKKLDEHYKRCRRHIARENIGKCDQLLLK